MDVACHASGCWCWVPHELTSLRALSMYMSAPEADLHLFVYCFQGTNAHLILAAPATATPSSTLVTTGGAGVPLPQQLAWRATRTWPLPPAHLIISAVSMASRRKAVFACQPDSPRLAFLHTHHVLQQPLLPTAALLEVAAAANAALSSGGGAGGSSMQCLQGVVFAAPCLLTGQLPELTCSISLDSGVVEVQSATTNSSRSNSKRLHMAANLASAGAAEASQDQRSSSREEAGFLQQLLAAQYSELQSGSQQPLCCSAAVQLSDSSSCGGLLSSNSPSEGFLLHPAALESALQMQALRQQQSSGDSVTELTVSAPATIKAYLLPTAAAPAVQSAQELLVSAVLSLTQPGAAAAHSSMQLSSGKARVACITEAEFRPMQAVAAASAAAAAAAARAASPSQAAAAPGTDCGVPAMGVEELSQLVQRTVEAVLGEPVDSQEPLMAAGLDSLGATEVRNSLQASLGLELPATLVRSCDVHGMLLLIDCVMVVIMLA